MLFLERNRSRLEIEEDKYLRIPSPEVVLHFGISKKFRNVGGCLKGVSPLQG